MGQRAKTNTDNEEPDEEINEREKDQEKTGDGEDGFIQDQKELIEELFERAEAYAKTNAELWKLNVISNISEVIASFVSGFIVIAFLLFFFLMINIGLSLWIGEAIGHVYFGFFIVSGIYLLIALILYMGSDQLLKNQIINSIISPFLK